MSKSDFSRQNLTRIYHETPSVALDPSDRIVIFSDLHLGNGKGTDDFRTNGAMFTQVLSDYYCDGNYSLILNGDIEELQRFRFPDIRKRWKTVYDVFDRFEQDGRLRRLIGNHDLDLRERADHDFTIDEALRFTYHDNSIFVFHGHQTSRRYENHNNVIRWVLRYLANPLQIGNFTVAADSRKRFKTERRVYDFASQKKILAVIGHTHRPLFESMSKNDAIQFEIERLCRKYPKSKKQEKIERRIEGLKAELQELRAERLKDGDSTSLYQEQLLVPSMFNSGCVLGKRGMTSLEIEKGRIRLVYWYDTSVKQKLIQYRSRKEEELPGTRFARRVIKEDSLDYVFSRIRLLA